MTSFSLADLVYAKEVEVQTNDLLVRSGPGASYEPIGHVNTGEIFPYVNEEDGWIAIDYASETGWISDQFATITNQDASEQVDEEEQSDSASESRSALVPYDVVNLRSAPSTNGTIVAEIPKGELILYQVNNNSDWVEVTWSDFTGYIPGWIASDASSTNPTTKTKSVLTDKVIVIDPGHGGVDVGATSVTDNFEKDYALTTSFLLKKHLEDLGATVYMTREDDYYYSLSPRGSLANFHHADVFLSIHYNSAAQYPDVTGMNTFYQSSNDRILAELIQESLIQQTGANDRGAEVNDYRVLNVSKRPGLLIELGFISNVQEEINIQSYHYQKNISSGIIQGLQHYFSSNQ